MVPDKDRRDRLAFAIRAAMGKRSAEAIARDMDPKRSKETVARWARGETVPSALDIGPLATALGVKIEFLVRPPELPSYPLDDYLISAEVFREMTDDALEAVGLAREDLEREEQGRQAAEAARAERRRKRPA